MNQHQHAALGRRSFLGALGLGAAGVTGGAMLTGCSSGGTPEPIATASTVDESVLPAYTPITAAEPDIPAEPGSIPGYTKLPTELQQSVPTPPGSGRTFTAMTPLWGTIPPSDSAYYKAVNEILGSTIKFQITDGNVYGDKLAAVLASAKDVPDWVCVPGWNIPPRFGTEIVQNVFADLTDYLAGDKINKYPNLANIPTDNWKACVFAGRLYGLPFPGTVIRDGIFYRKDLLDELGITPEVKSADDLLELAKELTDAGGGRWGAEDLWNGATMAFKVPSKWRLDDAGALIHRVETDEYRAALEWTAKLFAAKVVHPDAVAGQDGESKQRFQSGKALIMYDGLGGWHEALRDNLADNPSYDQRPLPMFAGDGSEPLLWKANAANIFSFLKQTDDTATIEELIALANVLAAPFGSTEFELINNGVEGVHFTRGAEGVPEPTALAAKELQPTYVFLCDPPPVEAKVQYPGYVEAAVGWMNDAAQYVEEPPFYGVQISEPPEYASIGQPFEDLEADIARGRKSLSDLDTAIKEWKAAGGEQLRAFYTELLDEE